MAGIRAVVFLTSLFVAWLGSGTALAQTSAAGNSSIGQPGPVGVTADHAQGLL
jgi:hypothetical protein